MNGFFFSATGEEKVKLPPTLAFNKIFIEYGFRFEAYPGDPPVISGIETKKGAISLDPHSEGTQSSDAAMIIESMLTRFVHETIQRNLAKYYREYFKDFSG